MEKKLAKREIVDFSLDLKNGSGDTNVKFDEYFKFGRWLEPNPTIGIEHITADRWGKTTGW